MRHDPATVGGVLGPTILPTFSVALGAALVLTLIVGAADGGPVAPRQPAAQQQRVLTAEQVYVIRQLAEQGDAKAQVAMGVAYLQGQGVRKDEKQALIWITKAADQEFAVAQAVLCRMYLEGIGVEKDEKQALIWLTKAADHGFAPAQYGLGGMYSVGTGVEKDLIEAYKWVLLAAARASGDELKTVAAVRDRLTPKLSPEQIAEAQKRVREWEVAFQARKK